MRELLTYDDYRDLSQNPVDEKTFTGLARKAIYKLNFLTGNRLSEVSAVPFSVKETLTEFVDILNSYSSNGVFGLSSYSNGIESFGYAIDESNPEKSLNAILWSKARENLSHDLTYRGF